GIGKTTLLNSLAGRVIPDMGEITIGQTVRIGYYTQDHSEMNGELKVIDYIKETAEIVKTTEGDVITAEQMLERFLFPRHMQRTFIRKLSGGEKRRLYLLHVLMQEPNVLFLDEPTNDLDTETLGVLEDYLDQFPGVVITVSHDRYFLDRVVDRLIVFEGSGVISRFQGSYSEYMEKAKTK
ncbi:ATP-binding cassette domain-containing protein, partial [Bacillus atrophaeus]